MLTKRIEQQEIVIPQNVLANAASGSTLRISLSAGPNGHRKELEWIL